MMRSEIPIVAQSGDPHALALVISPFISILRVNGIELEIARLEWIQQQSQRLVPSLP